MAAIVALVAACMATPAASDPVQSVAPATNGPQISVMNMSSVDIELFVNGEPVATVAAHTSQDPVPGVTLPALPWMIEARRPDTGFLLISTSITDRPYFGGWRAG